MYLLPVVDGDYWHLPTGLKLMLISRNQGKHEYNTQRTVTWERDALALNGFHERVLFSPCYPLIGPTRNLIFAGQVSFPRAGHIYMYTINSD